MNCIVCLKLKKLCRCSRRTGNDCILLQSEISVYSGYDVICHRIFGSADVCICIFLSEISYRADVSSIFGVFYVSVMLSYVYQTRMLPGGAYIVWLIFLCSWGCDTCAYCVGVLIGKHKMAPVLSPKKSWEGAVGGVVGAALLTLIYCFVFQGSMGSTNRDIIMLCMICAIGAIISMIGDLTASAIKRNYDIKDYGRLIPGHGGILDRFDSVIFTAPIIYYLALYLIGK